MTTIARPLVTQVAAGMKLDELGRKGAVLPRSNERDLHLAINMRIPFSRMLHKIHTHTESES